jgi:hypothetical protein
VDPQVDYINFLRWNIEVRKQKARIEWESADNHRKFGGAFGAYGHYLNAIKPPQDFNDEFMDLIYQDFNGQP